MDGAHHQHPKPRAFGRHIAQQDGPALDRSGTAIGQPGLAAQALRQVREFRGKLAAKACGICLTSYGRYSEASRRGYRRQDLRTGEIGASFVHRPRLIFHEAGHVVFRPFGEWMMFMGGTLGQLLMPVVMAVALLWKPRDPFGASRGLWFLGAGPGLGAWRLLRQWQRSGET